MRKIDTCHHDYPQEIGRLEENGTIEILYRCPRCGVRLLERYTFLEGRELDPEGSVVGTYYK
jgi:DNA-directed RNA polymerase subunit RPC12/RpoP